MIKVQTQSGSTYLLDLEKMTWERPIHSPESNQVRSESGELWNVPLIYWDKPMILLGPPIDETQDIRIITTTPVISIERY